jgi:TonB family protein
VKEAASQIISDRAQDGDGLRKTLIFSFVAHVACVAAMFAAPDSWGGATAYEPASMTIRLGGADAPGEGGLTSLGALPIQQVIPLTELRRPQWIQPPADILPQNIVPIPEAPRAEPESEVTTAPTESRGRRLTSGPRLQDGNAMSETGAEGIGVGLSAGGLGGDGSELSLSDFCCPEYLSTMVSLIRQRWNSNQETSGAAVVSFTVHRDGRIDSVDITRSSGFIALDQSARRAILLTRELPPLPRSFMENSLTVRLTFEYRR